MKYLLLIVLFASCISAKKYKVHMRDYQVLLHMDTVWIYDGKRLVGHFIKNEEDWKSKYDSIFIKDNL